MTGKSRVDVCRWSSLGAHRRGSRETIPQKNTVTCHRASPGFKPVPQGCRASVTCPRTCPRAPGPTQNNPTPAKVKKENPSISPQLTERFLFAWGRKRRVLCQLSYRVEERSVAQLAHGWQAEKCVPSASVPPTGVGRGRLIRTTARAQRAGSSVETHSATQNSLQPCSPPPDVR